MRRRTSGTRSLLFARCGRNGIAALITALADILLVRTGEIAVRIDKTVARLANHIIGGHNPRRRRHIVERNMRPRVIVDDDVVLKIKRPVGFVGVADHDPADERVSIDVDDPGRAILVDLERDRVVVPRGGVVVDILDVVDPVEQNFGGSQHQHVPGNRPARDVVKGIAPHGDALHLAALDEHPARLGPAARGVDGVADVVFEQDALDGIHLDAHPAVDLRKHVVLNGGVRAHRTAGAAAGGKRDHPGIRAADRRPLDRPRAAPEHLVVAGAFGANRVYGHVDDAQAVPVDVVGSAVEDNMRAAIARSRPHRTLCGFTLPVNRRGLTRKGQPRHGFDAIRHGHPAQGVAIVRADILEIAIDVVGALLEVDDLVHVSRNRLRFRRAARVDVSNAAERVLDGAGAARRGVEFATVHGVDEQEPAGVDSNRPGGRRRGAFLIGDGERRRDLRSRRRVGPGDGAGVAIDGHAGGRVRQGVRVREGAADDRRTDVVFRFTL